LLETCPGRVGLLEALVRPWVASQLGLWKFPKSSTLPGRHCRVSGMLRVDQAAQKYASRSNLKLKACASLSCSIFSGQGHVQAMTCVLISSKVKDGDYLPLHGNECHRGLISIEEPMFELVQSAVATTCQCFAPHLLPLCPIPRPTLRCSFLIASKILRVSLLVLQVAQPTKPPTAVCGHGDNVGGVAWCPSDFFQVRGPCTCACACKRTCVRVLHVRKNCPR